MIQSPTPEAVTARLAAASSMSDLDLARRLDAKLDMSPQGVTARLREASSLLESCTRLAQLASIRGESG